MEHQYSFPSASSSRQKGDQQLPLPLLLFSCHDGLQTNSSISYSWEEIGQQQGKQLMHGPTPILWCMKRINCPFDYTFDYICFVLFWSVTWWSLPTKHIAIFYMVRLGILHNFNSFFLLIILSSLNYVIFFKLSCIQLNTWHFLIFFIIFEVII